MPNGFGSIASTIPLLRLQQLYGAGNVEPEVTEMGGQPVFTNPNNPWEVTEKLAPSSGNEFEQPFDFAKRMGEIYTPETEATNRFNELIANQPQYEKPGFWRTAAAALSAFGPGGHQTGQQVLNEPYNRKLAQWKMGLEPAQQAANLERYSNANQRSLAHQTVTGELNARKAAQQAKYNEQRTQIGAFRAAVSAIRNLSGDWKIIKPRDGNIWQYNTKSGEFKDTNIPVTELGPREAMEMKLNNRLEEIDADFNNDKELATHKSMLDAARQQQNMEYEKNLGSDRFRPSDSAGSEGRPLSPTQKARDIWNKVGKLQAEFPGLGKYVKKEGSTGFKIDPNAPPEIRNMIMDYIGLREENIIDSGFKLSPSQTEGYRPQGPGANIPDEYRQLPPRKGVLDTLKDWSGSYYGAIGDIAGKAGRSIMGEPAAEQPPPPVPEGEIDFQPTQQQTAPTGPQAYTVNPKTKKVAVRRKADGKTGWVDRAELKSGMYEPFTPPQGSF